MVEVVEELLDEGAVEVGIEGVFGEVVAQVVEDRGGPERKGGGVWWERVPTGRRRPDPASVACSPRATARERGGARVRSGRASRRSAHPAEPHPTTPAEDPRARGGAAAWRPGPGTHRPAPTPPATGGPARGPGLPRGRELRHCSSGLSASTAVPDGVTGAIRFRPYGTWPGGYTVKQTRCVRHTRTARGNRGPVFRVLQWLTTNWHPSPTGQSRRSIAGLQRPSNHTYGHTTNGRPHDSSTTTDDVCDTLNAPSPRDTARPERSEPAAFYSAKSIPAAGFALSARRIVCGPENGDPRTDL